MEFCESGSREGVFPSAARLLYWVPSVRKVELVDVKIRLQLQLAGMDHSKEKDKGYLTNSGPDDRY